MANFKKRFSIKLMIAVGGVVAVFIATLVVGADITRRVTHIQEIKTGTAVKEKAATALTTLQDQSAKADPHLGFLHNILPLHDQLINFPRDLRAIAIRNNADLEVSFGTEQSGDTEKPGFATFQGSLRASLEDFRNFLRDVERSKYFVNFATFDISGDRGNYTIRLSGEVFFR